MRTVELTDAESSAIAAILGNALDQDHDTYEGDYFWFLLSDVDTDAFSKAENDPSVSADVLRETWRAKFDELREVVNSALSKVTRPPTS